VGDWSLDHRWRSPVLGDAKTLNLPHGELRYFDRGGGPTIVFAHGWLANANLWRNVVDRLALRYRCVSLDLPFGSHFLPMSDSADLTPSGCGQLIASAIGELGVDDVTLVGNDSGGAYSQIAVAMAGAKVSRLVLNSCETPFDEFPPPPFDTLPEVASNPEQLRSLLSALEDPEARPSPLAYGQLIKHTIPDEVSDGYALPSLRDPLVLRDELGSSPEDSFCHARVARGPRSQTTGHRPVLLTEPDEDWLLSVARGASCGRRPAPNRTGTVDRGAR
jgi:pimeloyl-ACP methyl ester carboxylesterase